MRLLLILLLAVPSMLKSQTWELQEDFSGIITDIEYHEGDRYITFLSGEVWKNDTLLTIFPVQNTNETGLHSIIFWNDSLCVCLSSLDSFQRVICGTDTLLEVDYRTPWSSRHRAGDMLVIDSTLYISIGHGGQANDAQDLTNLRGKIYAITDSTSYIYAYGLRNAWKIANEADTIWIADNGKDLQEELDRVWIPESNFGWPCMEGRILHVDTCGPTVLPYFVYDHVAASNSIIGGKVFQGSYYCCDHYSQSGWKFSGPVPDTIPCPQWPTGFAVNLDTLFVYTWDGKIFRWNDPLLSIDEELEDLGETLKQKRLRWWREELREEMIKKYGDLHIGLDRKEYQGLPQIPGLYWSLIQDKWIMVTR